MLRLDMHGNVVNEIHLWDYEAYSKRYKWPYKPVDSTYLFPPSTKDSENIAVVPKGTQLVIKKLLYDGVSKSSKKVFQLYLVEAKLKEGNKEGFVFSIEAGTVNVLEELDLSKKINNKIDDFEKLYGYIDEEKDKILKKLKTKIDKYKPNSFDFIFFKRVDEDDRANKLKAIQQMVIDLPCIQQGAKGIYGMNTSSTETFCNHAVYLTIKATDDDYMDFLGVEDEPPWRKGREQWCDELEKKVESGKIEKVSAERAQEFANAGHTVVGSWRNTGGIPHWVTVSPDNGEYKSDEGPMVTHVGGGTSGVKKSNLAYPANKINEILWYYNPNQKFVYKPETVEQYNL